MIESEMNRRFFLGSAIACAIVGGCVRVGRAQPADGVLDPILDKAVWRDPGEFRRLQRLIWTTYDLKYIYRDSFEEKTGQKLPDSAEYAGVVERLAGQFPVQIATNLPDDRLRVATPSFQAALAQNAPAFLDWLEGSGVNPEGPLATGLLQGQALFALLRLLLDGFATLEDLRAADDDDCELFYPLC